MAEETENKSKFLHLQDSNGDGLIDACEVELKLRPPPDCPECVPNAAAVVPDWKTRDIADPFLNEKICMYQITVTTEHRTTFGNHEISDDDTDEEVDIIAAAAIEEIYEEYIYVAIEGLLDAYDKLNNSGTQSLIYDVIERTNWTLGIRSTSSLKLLYSVSSETLDALPPAEDDEDEDEDDLGEVSYDAEELLLFNMQVRKGLYMYARNLKVYRSVENSNILFLNDNSVFNLDLYGDWGLGAKSSKMAKLITELDSWLNKKGYNLQGHGSFITEAFNSNRLVKRITFNLDSSEKTLSKITIEADGCESEPIVFTKKLSTLKKSGSAWNDKTALVYLVQLREMVDALTASEPMPWIEFVQTFTYPSVYTVANSTYDHSDQAASCLGAALANEAKQLGEDIMDEVFSLGDAIAYQFHKQRCAKTPEELQAIKEEMGLYLSPEMMDWVDDEGNIVSVPRTSGQVAGGDMYNYKLKGSMSKINNLAKEQMFGRNDPDDGMYGDFCAWLFGDGEPSEEAQENAPPTAKEAWDDFREKKNRLKLCGLLDVLTEALKCLFAGLTLEQALSKMIEAALKGMSVKNFGDLFLGLPADKQAEIQALAKKKLADGDLFATGSSNEAAMNEEAGDYDEISAGGAAETTTEEATEGTSTQTDTEQAAASTFAEESDTSNYAGNPLQSLLDHDWIEKQDWESRSEDTTGGSTYGDWESWQDQNQATLAPGFFATAGKAGSPGTIISAYIQAILEVYVGEELEIVDILGNFPGAPIISKIIATVSCPNTKYFNPAIADFMKDWELPICRNNKKIAFPVLVIPPRHKFTDLWLMLKNAVKMAIAQMIQRVLILIFVKLCQITANAACKALEIAGQLAKNAITKENTMAEIVRDAICGENATDEQLANTVNDLFAAFGNGSAAFSDTDTAMDFAFDLSAAVTQDEMTEAFLGEASDEFSTAAIELCNNDYPQYSDAFADKEAVKKAFGNMGNVLPADFRDRMRDGLGSPTGAMPSNPSLCATEDQYEQFCQNRAALLTGRASPSQIRDLCDNFKNDLLEDLGDIAPIMNDLPGYLDDNMPPLISDPGCDNGIIPYEAPLAADVAAASLSNRLEMLKLSYAEDMLGNGPGKRNWGLMNMVLSDTMGQPLTTHNRKTSNQRDRVDFYTEWTLESLKDAIDENFPDLDLGDPMQMIMLTNFLMSTPSVTSRQKGAFPFYVGEWMREQLYDLDFTYNINNDKEFGLVDYYIINYEDMPGYSRMNENKLELMSLPDFGYNVLMRPNAANRYVEIIKRARKDTPDITLQYRDNAKGIEDYEFAYGCDVETYFADLEPVSKLVDPYSTKTSNMRNRPQKTINEDDGTEWEPSDSTRIKIYNVYNPSADLDSSEAEMIQNPVEKSKWKKYRLDQGTTIKESFVEFMGVDPTFDGINFDEYPKFVNAFTQYQDQSPLIVLLAEMLNNNGHSLSTSDIKSAHTSIMQFLNEKIRDEVANNEPVWIYGAAPDLLRWSDAEYVIPDNTPKVPEEYWGGPYQDAYIEEETEPDTEEGVSVTTTRKILNDDMILGVSKMQYLIDKGEYSISYGDASPTTDDDEFSIYDGYISVDSAQQGNRVFYLDPTQYGGTYMNPPVYIMPIQHKGWYGLLDSMFPELSECKGGSTDFVDFADIQELTDEIYRYLSDDPRMGQDPECLEEVPFDRLMARDDKAFMFGLVTAAARIFASAHFIKALPVMSTFVPKFPNSYSSIYAAYILEYMEKAFKDATSGFAEFFTTFKDEEFWYAFLEQSVQTYAHFVDNEIIEPTPAGEAALSRLNQVQREYETKSKTDLKLAKDNDEVRKIKLLKHYREEDVLDTVREHDEDAKIILQELIVQQLNILGQKWVDNLEGTDLSPVVKDLDYYILENFTVDSSLSLNETTHYDGSFDTSYPDFPTVPFEENEEADEPYYTYGGEFVIGEDADSLDGGRGVGEEYIGYYHIHVDEETEELAFMAGEYHTADLHDILTPVINLVQVPIGDVPVYGSRSSATSESYEKPFFLEKYISINGTRFAPDEAVDIIKSNDPEALLADIYPGTLEAVGSSLIGEFGVRYGLSFSILINGNWYEITSVEVDALDRMVKQFTTLTSDSALLLCLINHLKQDDKYKMATQYIIPVKKMVSMMAIYVDMGLLSSIGEVTVADGEAWEGLFSAKLFDPFENYSKPGSFIKIETEEETDPDTDETTETITSVLIEGNAGWASKDDRNVWSLLFLEFDDWDQELLKNSKSRIKRLFKSAYRRKKDFDTEGLKGGDLSKIFRKRLKEQLKIPTGDRILPWFRRRRIRSNPFNAKGYQCENEE